MKLKSVLLSFFVLSFASTQAFAGWGRIRLPHVEWPGSLKVPPLRQWKIGGDLGRLRESNKAALTLSTVGSATLGPIGWFYGFLEGHKTDEQMRAAKRMKERFEADVAFKQQVVDASNRFPDQANQISAAYTDGMSFFGDRPATPQAAYDELNAGYWEATYCLITAADAAQADDCKFNFQDISRDVQRRYR